ncbi:MAG: hypothetical protein AAFY76_26630 [Cyanobacteria bacterium J06649_11]
MLTDGERRRRLSVLCKRLRGNESLRSFARNHSKELQGISHSSWSAWEAKRAGLSADSLDKFASFIGCSHQSLFAYLDGSKSLEDLLQPDSSSDKSEEEFKLSANAAITWMESLSLSDKFLIASQGFNSFQKELDKLIEEKAEKLAEQKAKELIQNISTEYIDSDIQKFTEQETEKLVNKEIRKELAQEIIEETSKLLLNLFSSDKYPLHSEIIKVAEKLNLNVENLVEICDRIYLDKTQKQHKQSA